MFVKNILEEIRTHVLCSIVFFPENRCVDEIMGKNGTDPGRPQMTI